MALIPATFYVRQSARVDMACACKILVLSRILLVSQDCAHGIRFRLLFSIDCEFSGSVSDTMDNVASHQASYRAKLVV